MVYLSSHCEPYFLKNGIAEANVKISRHWAKCVP